MKWHIHQLPVCVHEARERFKVLDYEQSLVFGVVRCASRNEKSVIKKIVSALCGTLGVRRTNVSLFRRLTLKFHAAHWLNFFFFSLTFFFLSLSHAYSAVHRALSAPCRRAVVPCTVHPVFCVPVYTLPCIALRACTHNPVHKSTRYMVPGTRTVL